MKTMGSSAFLSAQKPVLQKLIAELLKEYDYASVLAMDNSAKRYSVSGQGVYARQDAMYTNRGFVVRVRKGGRNAEYSFNHIDEAGIPAIVSKIEGELQPMAEHMPLGITVMERGEDREEPCSFVKGTEYEVHPEELGSEKILEELQKLRAAGRARSEQILDVFANFSYQEIHKLFLSRDRDLEQNLLWTNGSLLGLARKG